ncbi:LysE family translocator [Bradyrhizobium sp. CCGUVB4N]|uniref:LysE family translocator n=1 Tax=Bradyrhizobium sp. CCGUVB4N TaxID=2949631 RepID=UPI0020B24975|nr:LysE family translocator [Bradyrhizobium sp. CCGUVB4N]MCP3383029.1 LysE family translocator [Bradyrhizobium sp. CCGUVB4N]
MLTFLAFIGTSIIVIVTPGPDTATTIRNTLLAGRTGGICTAAGIAVGQTIWALATSVGLAALLVASASLFLAIKYLGAAYLIYLGIIALYEALWPPEQGSDIAVENRLHGRVSPWMAFRQGMISDLGNPKMAVFFTSLLPQFAPTGGSTFATLLALGIVFAGMTFVWLAVYAAAIHKVRHALQRPTVRRLVEGVTGTVLIALGLRIATEQR